MAKEKAKLKLMTRPKFSVNLSRGDLLCFVGSKIVRKSGKLYIQIVNPYICGENWHIRIVVRRILIEKKYIRDEDLYLRIYDS